jgi:hypothetical protein
MKLMKQFNREKVFASVDESNKRFENYSDEERRKFREEAKKQFKSGREQMLPQWLKKRITTNDHVR